jgi:hypothetical protein
VTLYPAPGLAPGDLIPPSMSHMLKFLPSPIAPPGRNQGFIQPMSLWGTFQIQTVTGSKDRSGWREKELYTDSTGPADPWGSLQRCLGKDHLPEDFRICQKFPVVVQSKGFVTTK